MAPSQVTRRPSVRFALPDGGCARVSFGDAGRAARRDVERARRKGRRALLRACAERDLEVEELGGGPGESVAEEAYESGGTTYRLRKVTAAPARPNSLSQAPPPAASVVPSSPPAERAAARPREARPRRASHSAARGDPSGSDDAEPPRGACERCGASFVRANTGRPRRTCSARCRTAACRERARAAAPEPLAGLTAEELAARLEPGPLSAPEILADLEAAGLAVRSGRRWALTAAGHKLAEGLVAASADRVPLAPGDDDGLRLPAGPALKAAA